MNEIDTNDWVIVDGFIDLLIHAEIVRGRLEAEGIPAILGNRHLVTADWLYSQAMGGVRILVPPGYVVEAREVIAGIDAGEFLEMESEPDRENACRVCGGVLAWKNAASWKFSMFISNLLMIPIPFRKNLFYCPRCHA